MQMDFLVDTDVLSETSKQSPHPAVLEFIESAGNILIPAAALIEILKGISEVFERSVTKSVKLSAWYTKLTAPETGIPIIFLDLRILDVLAVLLSDRRLNNLKLSRPDSPNPRCGFDLWIAATAIVHRAAIATFNVKDYMLINQYYPLPGVYDPRSDIWHTKMDPLEFPSPSDRGSPSDPDSQMIREPHLKLFA